MTPKLSGKRKSKIPKYHIKSMEKPIWIAKHINHGIVKIDGMKIMQCRKCREIYIYGELL